VISLGLDLALYALSAVFAGLTAQLSTLAAHGAWGAIAVWGYAAAALLVFLFRKRLWLTVLAWIAVAWVPLVVLAYRGVAQEEVTVVERAAQRLLDTGTPYLSRAALATEPEPLLGYTPYQPAMAVFGLPRAAFGAYWWTDARLWFALATAAVLVGATRLLWPHPGLVRALQMATVLPLCALALATGGDDVPVMALCLLAFAFAARDRQTAAGVAIGAAAAMKLLAWPVLIVLAVFAWPHRRYFLGALGIPALTMLPALLSNADALVENVIRFPAGHGLVTSPAASPLIGYQIAQHVPQGHTVALGLLLAAGLAIGIYLVRRPPRTAKEVALVSAIGLLAAILLLPSTRFGYLLYPVAFAFWAPCLQAEDSASPA
jgi:Glycosyltransferase family 87